MIKDEIDVTITLQKSETMMKTKKAQNEGKDYDNSYAIRMFNQSQSPREDRKTSSVPPSPGVKRESSFRLGFASVDNGQAAMPS